MSDSLSDEVTAEVSDLIGTLPMADMEELNEQFGKFVKVMERFKYRAGEEDLGAAALVLEMTKALERVSLLVVWAWAPHFNFPRKILRFAFVGILNTRGRVQFEGRVRRSRSRPSRPFLSGSKWSCLLLPRIVLQDASE